MLNAHLWPLRPAFVLLAFCQVCLCGAQPAAFGETSCKSQPEGGATPAATNQVVARIGKTDVKGADVIAENKKDFDAMEAGFDLKIRQLHLQREEERYALLKQQTDRMLDSKSLDLEAQARHRSREDLLATVKVDTVTEKQVRDYYDANKWRTSRSFDELKDEITQYLALEHNKEANRRYLDALRGKYDLVDLIEPYRVQVDSTGPSRGKPSAPITVVEFADFQCPFCRQAESTLRTVVANHPDDVRVVFRQLPLASVHPQAVAAARTSVCADRQGKFWPMHDALYADQAALTDPGLKETAQRIGLDTGALAACVDDPNTTHTIENDLRTADELNISSTPYFLINGIPVKGNVEPAQFEAVITEELKRKGAKRG
jgi:protein-disulfide isomerase